MPIQRRGSALKHYQRRVAWLTAHPLAWNIVPSLHDDVTDAGRLQLDLLVEAMKAAKLLPASLKETNRETIRRLVTELRGEHVEVGW